MLTVLLPANGEGFAIEDENAAWCVWIGKDSTREIAVQALQDRHMTLRACGADSAVRASVKHVTVMECRCRFSASAFHSERVLAGVASPTSSAEPDSLSGTAECALFFMDEIGEG